MKVIVAPDKFKGSLSSFEVCTAMASGILEADPTVDVLSFPMADGGDGFAAVLKHYLKTETINCASVDPLGRNIEASYEWQEADKTAIVELSIASGLALLKKEEHLPLLTSTYGTGLLIKAAIEKGAQKIMLGIGGSATNDAGTGILCALGFTFLDNQGNKLSPIGKNLTLIDTIVQPDALPALTIQIACDVFNPLFGPRGAAYVYAPQKGATTGEVELLDKGLQHFASVLKRQTGYNVADVPGTGASGGIAAGLLPFFRVSIIKGIDLVIEAGGLNDYLPMADVMFTGEGRIDAQTKEGKVIGTLAGLCKAHNMPLIALCGQLNLSIEEVKELGVSYIASIVNGPASLEECMQKTGELLKHHSARCLLFYKEMMQQMNRQI